MNCPHCDGPIENPTTRIRRERRELGICIECKTPLPLPHPSRYARCLPCRRKANAAARRRHN